MGEVPNCPVCGELMERREGSWACTGPDGTVLADGADLMVRAEVAEIGSAGVEPG